MNSQSKLTNEEIRERLEQRADTVRTRLLNRLDALDERRHRLMNATAVLGREAKHLLPLVGGVVAGIGVLTATVVVIRRRRERQRAWLNVAERLLAPPQPERSSLIANVAKKAAFTFAARFARRVAERIILGAEHPPGLPAATHGVSPGEL